MRLPGVTPKALPPLRQTRVRPGRPSPMILGIGTDLCNIERIEKTSRTLRRPLVRERVFTALLEARRSGAAETAGRGAGQTAAGATYAKLWAGR